MNIDLESKLKYSMDDLSRLQLDTLIKNYEDSYIQSCKMNSLDQNDQAALRNYIWFCFSVMAKGQMDISKSQKEILHYLRNLKNGPGKN